LVLDDPTRRKDALFLSHLRGDGMLEISDCCLVIVDVQGTLAQLMVDKESLFRNIGILIGSARILEMPILWCQQVPEALGPTVPEIAERLPGLNPIDKASFSCCGDEQFNVALEKHPVRQALVSGIETHVCVYQTALDLLDRGLDVTVVADAVSSRTESNKQIGLTRLTAEGARIGSTEMVLFELLKTARHPKFKQIAKLVK
jgi:nicotinamidase-related amidase